MTLSFGQKAFFATFPGFVLAAAWVGFPAVVQRTVFATGPDESKLAGVGPERGHALYQQHCAYCHGVDGKGDGPAELEPKARNFGFEQFKFATTQNRMPTDADLMAVLNRGIPGSAMPSFATLSNEDKQLLIEQVRTFARAGLATKIAKKLAEDYDLGEHYSTVAKLIEPGPTIEFPASFGEATEASLANGKKIFTQRCVSCHGAKGLGDGNPAVPNDEGRLVKTKNLTLGIYGGGDTHRDLYARIKLGFGKSMSENPDLSPQEITDLVNYTKSLFKPAPPEKPEAAP
jgi:mono/diheme cytochrome c family protein